MAPLAGHTGSGVMTLIAIYPLLYARLRVSKMTLPAIKVALSSKSVNEGFTLILHGSGIYVPVAARASLSLVIHMMATETIFPVYNEPPMPFRMHFLILMAIRTVESPGDRVKS